MALLNCEAEAKLFEERLNSDFYQVERAKNTGENYVDSGKLDRDTQAVEEYASSQAFDVIRKM